MSRDRRRWEESSSHYRPAYGRSYGDDHDRRHHSRSADPHPGRRFNYWRDESEIPTSYLPRHSYGRDSYEERWRNEDHHRHIESSYFQRGHDSDFDRHWDDRDSWRDRSPPHESHSRNRYRTYTPSTRITHPDITEATRRFSPPIPPKEPRKSSPPPKMTPQPLKPDSGYLSLSQEASQVMQDPGQSRKLVVLDLNGTLLNRSPRRTLGGQRLRCVQPRPYMQSFREYLFCPQTREWLDTMVWSSAQPHSVEDMVDKVFGVRKDGLKAVWNRKSLGLSDAEYHQKSITTKDLRKPWKFFESAANPAEAARSPASFQSPTTHSALTTLLLDDSPHKAVLQPYNHVCIPEYDGKKRHHDLQSFLATKEPKKSKRDKKAKGKDRVEGADPLVAELSPTSASPESTENEAYDAILLATIGILETIKMQSNVAGWIRKGGLWAMQARLEKVNAFDVKSDDVTMVDGTSAVSNTVVQSGNDDCSTSDPAMTSGKAHLQAKMWFDDPLVVAYWIARGRDALTELGIPIVHGLTG